MDNKEKGKKYDSIFGLEEYFSIEDYSSYLMAKTGIEKTETKQLNPSMIRLMFQIENNKSIDIIVQKADIEKIYEHIKIYEPNKKKFINLLTNREEVNKNDLKGILTKINSKSFLKTIFIDYLKIKEFPLIKYSLEQQNNEGEIKTYILKENSEGNINMNQNNGVTLIEVGEWEKWRNNLINQNKNKNINSNMGQSNSILSNNNNALLNNNFQNYQINNCNINGNQIMNPMPFMHQNINNNLNSYTNNQLFINTDNKKQNVNGNIKISSCLKKYDEIFFSIGLDNVGLSCYMNSTLQLLLHIPELNSFFINIYPKQKDKFKKINKDADTKGRLSEEYYDLVKNMKEFVPKKYYYRNNYYGNYYYYSKSISPKTFNNVLSVLNPQFGKFESNDSKDLILYLIQSMHAELNYIENQKLKSVPKCNQTLEMDSYNFFLKVNSELNLSIFSYLFYGIIKSSTKCLSCKNVLYNYQYFQFLSFPTFNYKDKQMNIYQGLNDFKKPEIMKGDNKCYCQKCQGLRDAKVSSEIFYTPPYLLINFDYGKNKKYSPTKVDFGEEIDLTDFTDKKCIEKKYELIGVSTHIGASGNSGHYIAYCKDIKNKLWYQFNDSFVNKCSFNEVNSNNPCLLVFKKKN